MSIESLFKQAAELLTDHAMEGSDFRESSMEDRTKIADYITNIIDAYKNKEFSKFISELMALKDYQVNIYPEAFHPTYSDFFLDTSMWDWVFDSVNKDTPNEHDWKAASFIIEDLKERIENNEIFG
jgi:hypothetical protein